ncbi:hypothetical protein BDZ90DRAFT_160270 [Jaminaea rosea]|uniref:Uncharacterized protein n=1 Tax=Jaminaea rosea TaxID=1569628 RepID=A0A316UTA4_9BASI|nr:hypothetical protein BDZ90DRAFT_160270 [Jaminaea rosea]PWN28028.1 hypothetical protein BDZ90DRAFT_160270 [Jaminaea rosea]
MPKAKRKAQSEGSDEGSSASKKDTGDSPKSPRKSGGQQPASSKDWTEAHWNMLNKAIEQIAVDHVAQIVESHPDLAPWKPKGRLQPKVRQLMRTAKGAGKGGHDSKDDDGGVGPSTPHKKAKLDHGEEQGANMADDGDNEEAGPSTPATSSSSKAKRKQNSSSKGKGKQAAAKEEAVDDEQEADEGAEAAEEANETERQMHGKEQSEADADVWDELTAIDDRLDG